MTAKTLTSSLLCLALGASLAHAQPLPGRLHYGRCGPDRHTEAYPHARYERHAYGCKSDDDGFLEGPAQGDKRRN